MTYYTSRNKPLNYGMVFLMAHVYDLRHADIVVSDYLLLHVQ